MRVAVWGTVLGAGLGLASTAHGDIYRYRTQSGALVFTNAPVENATRFIIISRKPVLRPAPRVTVPTVRPAVYTALSQPIPPAAPTSYDALIRDVAERYDVEYALVKAVIKAESDFNRLAVSPKGALGLMQLMPETAAQHMVRNVFLPRDNIEGGTRHLRMLLDRYRGSLPLAIAAYNAGTKRVEEAGGIPAIPETREYLARVMRYRLAYLRENAGVVALRR
jgi:soluble lytic murein transglycosylase-like protein